MDEDWEELDESAMDECMVLATQLCTQQPQDAGEGHTSNHTLKVPQSKSYPDTGDRKAAGAVGNGSVNHVRDSGVCSTRSSSLHHSASNVTNGSMQPRKDAPTTYMSRFSDFSTKSTSSHPNTATRKPVPVPGSGKGPGLLVSGCRSRSSPSKAQSPTKPWPGSEAAAGGSSNPSLKKVEEDKAKLNERILLMQGEISLLRSERKRKETLLETERLDHCAAIEAAEKRAREKVAKQAAEADTKLKEKSTAVEKLQGELHFKKREVEELLQRCHRLEQQPQASQTSAPASKRPRIDKNSGTFAKDVNSSISSRFDFSRRPVRVCAGVQTEDLPHTELPPPKNAPRARLDVASPRGQVCPTRSIATLLSCSGLAASQHTAASSSSSSPWPALACGSAGWSLPSHWLNIISQALREKDKSVEQKLVGVAVERLQQTRVAASQSDGDHCRLMPRPDDPTEWYECQVGPAIQVLQHFKSCSELSTLQAITAHLAPVYVKDVIVNRRICSRLLEATERISRFIKPPIDTNNRNTLVSALRECCVRIENGSEAGTLLRVGAALSPHCRLCVSSDVCLICQLCKKVKKLCVPEVDILKALLDLTWATVKFTLPSLWLSSSCPCSSQLLGTFIWHLYQTLEASHHTAQKRKVYQALVSCVEVLHHWSTVDPDWWEKVSPFPQYPALMATMAAKAKEIKFDRGTVELLCDLYEFEDGTFER